MRNVVHTIGNLGHKVIHHSPDGMHLLYLVSAAGVWHELHAVFAGGLAVIVAIELIKGLMSGG